RVRGSRRAPRRHARALPCPDQGHHGRSTGSEEGISPLTNRGQVRTWASWHRWSLMVMVGYAFLAVCRLRELRLHPPAPVTCYVGPFCQEHTPDHSARTLFAHPATAGQHVTPHQNAKNGTSRPTHAPLGQTRTNQEPSRTRPPPKNQGWRQANIWPQVATLKTLNTLLKPPDAPLALTYTPK